MLHRLLNFFRARRLEADIRDEIEFHRAQSSGSFGNSTLIADHMRDASTIAWLENVWRDVRFAIRLLARSPVFTVTAILSLALGIGANTAIFSLADAVLLKQLPVRHPERLRMIEWSSEPRFDMPSSSYDGDCEMEHGRHVCGSFSYPLFQSIENLPQFAGVIGFADWDLVVTADDRSESALGHLVSGNYFRVLGVKPLAGRILTASDDGVSQPLTAVISYRYWTRHFGQDRFIVGRVVLVNNKPATIVGIAPDSFRGLYPGSEPDFYLPVSKTGEIGARYYLRDKPDHWWFRIFARLAPGVTDEQAHAALNAAFLHQTQAYSGKDLHGKARVEVKSGARGLNILRRDMSLQIYILATAVGLVLLIACSNLANLLLARATARRREVALRLSIGASRGRLLRQLMTESLLLSLAGGALGVLLAKPLMHFLLTSRYDQPDSITATLDGRALAFAFAISLVCGLLFSVVPALRATKLDLGTALKDGALAGAGASPRLRLARFLVAGQVALSLVLLVGAGLFIRTLVGLLSVPLGFEAENLLTFHMDPSLSGLKAEKLAALYERMLESIERVPGVRSAALSRHGLIELGTSGDQVGIPGRPPKTDDSVALHFCSYSFLRTIQTPVRYGRDLSPSDTAHSLRVAIVNEAFVRKYLPEKNPLGRIFFLGDPSKAENLANPIQIVGVAADAHYRDLRSEPPPTAYVPFEQHLDNLQQTAFLVRTALPPLSLAEQIRKAVAKVDHTVPLAFVRTEQQVIDRSLGAERLSATLVSSLGIVAALLAAIGLYGVISYSVSRRTAEIGVRLALGATRRDVVRLVVGECLWFVLAGLAVGVPAALGLTRLVEKTLFGVKATDPATYAIASILMILICAFAALIPARRAARIEPVIALKYE